MALVRTASALAAALIVAALAHTQEPTVADRVIVTVNGEAIRATDISAAARSLAASARQSEMKISREEIFSIATGQVIDATLLAQEARRLGIELDDTQVAAALAEAERGAGGREGLETSLSEAGMSYEQLRNALEKTMLARAYVDTVIRPEVSISDEDVAAFYADNPEMFAEPERVKARHILIAIDVDAPEAEVTAARARAEAARSRALAGEDFAALAKELSKGPSAPRGGDLGWISAADTVEPFTTVAFGLDSGSISEVVRTRYGFHVILVEGHREPGTSPLDEVRDGLREALVDRAVAERAETLLQELRDKAEVVPVALPSASQEPPADGKEDNS
jgi:parvulin-like peptidyl-prolyl isomerase